jgi:hypothetical protein
MTLKELILAVKEKNLTKDKLENYRDDMSNLFAQMQFELVEIEKMKAFFFDNRKTQFPEDSDISIKRVWQASQNGLREIELKRYCLATKEMLNSLKSRLYSIY